MYIGYWTLNKYYYYYMTHVNRELPDFTRVGKYIQNTLVYCQYYLIIQSEFH